MSTSKNKMGKLVRFGLLCLKKWPWFLASMTLSLVLAVAYLLIAQPQYTREAQLLIKEDSKSRTTALSDLNAITDQGIFTSATNVNNELSRIQSKTLIGNVVKRLHLDVDYMRIMTLRKRTVYGKENPIVVQIMGLDANEPCEFELALDSTSVLKYARSMVEKNEQVKDSASQKKTSPVDIEIPKPKFTIKSVKVGKNDIDGEYDGTFETSLTIANKVRVLVSHNVDYKDYYSEKSTLTFPENILIKKRGFVDIVESCSKKLKVSLIDKKSTVINLDYQDAVAQRAEDFLVELVEAYNQNLLEGKNKIAEHTSKFISDRLTHIERELGNVDENISTYKSRNLTPDVGEVAKLHLDKASMVSDRVTDLDNKLTMLEYIRDFIANNKNKDFLPAVTNITNQVIERSVEEYNEILVKRNQLVANSSVKNPMVVSLDQNLANLTKGILVNIDSQIDAINGQMINLRRTAANSKAKIASSPTQTKYLLGVERQQKVKESLYLFLLQKREENELSQAFSAYNNQMITEPIGKLEATSPIRKNILIVAFLLGLLIPAAVIWIMESIKGRVYKLEDLDGIQADILGEIPFNKNYAEKIVVASDKSDEVNSAFRKIRTNIETQTGEDNKNAIMVSALHEESGKDFVAMNLAKVFSLKQKRTVLVNFDVHSKFFAKNIGNHEGNGICDYLSESNPSLSNYIKRMADDENLFVIPTGKVPAHPSDLLNESKLQTLVDFLKASYDVVILNCPSSAEESANELIGKLVDRTVFVMHSVTTRAAATALLNDYIEEERYKGISLVLNRRVKSK